MKPTGSLRIQKYYAIAYCAALLIKWDAISETAIFNPIFNVLIWTHSSLVCAFAPRYKPNVVAGIPNDNGRFASVE